jgi:magnesium chelatase subunit H
MANQGSGGAYEISQRMTAMVGWGATTNFTEDWTWDQAAETYALDLAMADKLRKNNPEAKAPFCAPLLCQCCASLQHPGLSSSQYYYSKV